MRTLAIDLTFNPTGGTLAQVNQIIENLSSYDFDKILFYITPDNRHLFREKNDKKIILKCVKFSNQSIILRTIWAQIILPVLLVLNQVDLLFCPGNISPIFNSKRKVQCIHTIGPFEKDFVSYFSFKERLRFFIIKYLMIFSSYTSDMVIYDSNYTRDIFVKRYRQKIEKSSVIHSGNNNFFKPVDSKTSKVHADTDYKDYILTVSHLYPYKNIEILIHSFNRLKLHERGIYILVAGTISDKKYHKKLQLLLDQYGISKYVIFLGRLEIKELRELYSQCKIFVFTSPYENFAYTLIEAMCCATPIIATNTTAMPESCGNAALYFSPTSEKELSECIMKYLNNEQVRLDFKKLALIKSKEYPTYSSVNSKINNLFNQLF